MPIYVRSLRPQPSIECTAGLNCCVLMDVRQSIHRVEISKEFPFDNHMIAYYVK